MKTKLFIFSVFLFFSRSLLAASCTDYPYDEGMSVQETDAGIKLISTGAVSISSGDQDSIRDSKNEATLEAKLLISKFLNEEIESDEKITKIVNETKSMQGSNKDIVRSETIERLKNIRNSSKALLKGVVILGNCYTKDYEVRVSVGIKPETIIAVEKLNGRALDKNKKLNSTNSNIKDPLLIEGESNTRELDKF